MLKKLMALGCYLLPVLVKSQLVLSIQLPPAGFVQKDQLWNLILTNNTRGEMDVRMQMNLQDAATGQVVLSANTAYFNLIKGMKVISSKDIQPISYVYNVPELLGNYLPIGAFIVSYQVSSNKDELLVQERANLNIDPLSPPLLNSPSDKSEIETPYPQFSWMPPMPYEMFTDLSYDLLITEVLQGQSPVEAIEYNSPLYTRSNLINTFESYASSFQKLDTGKLYAWQVIAKNGLSYAAKTEVWTFKILPPSFVKMLIEQSPYVKMKRANPEKGVAPNSILKISYTNETIDTTLTIQIRDLNKPVERNVNFNIKVGRGENLIQKDLQKIINVKEGELYEASIINSRNERWSMLFEIRQYKEPKK